MKTSLLAFAVLLMSTASAHKLYDDVVKKYAGVPITENAAYRLNEVKQLSDLLDKAEENTKAAEETWSRAFSSHPTMSPNAPANTWLQEAKNKEKNLRENLIYSISVFEISMSGAKETFEKQQGARAAIEYAETKRKADMDAAAARRSNEVSAVELEAARPVREAAIAESKAGKITKAEAMKRMKVIPHERAAVVESFKAGRMSYETAMKTLRGEIKIQPEPDKTKPAEPVRSGGLSR